MRLHDTLTALARRASAAARPIGMYVCGPTVYQRAHIGNSRPFVVFIVDASWLRANGLRGEARPQHHRRQRQDLRGGAGRERAAGRRGDGVVPRGRGALRARPAGREPKRDRDDARDHRADRGARGRDHAYARDGDVYFRVASFPEYGRLSGQRPIRWRTQEPNPLKEDPRDFALWKANEAGRGHVPGTRRGGAGGRAGTSSARRWRRSELGPEFEIHGGGLDLVFPHHENELAQSRSVGHPIRADLDAQRDARASTRREDVEVARERRDDPRRARPLGPRDAARLLPHGALAQAARLLGRDDGRGRARRRRRLREASAATSQRRRASWERFAAALEDDFNTPAALAVMHEWRARVRSTLLRRALDVFGLGALAGADVGARPTSSQLAERRLEARAEARLRGGRPAPGRDPSRRAGKCATRPARSGSCACE